MNKSVGLTHLTVPLPVHDNVYYYSNNFVIGLVLAISSSLLIGSSFIFKKIALNRLSSKGVRAGDGGFGYLYDWVWWTGLLLMFFGELINFTAYAFAPATLVTPLGVLSVLVSSVLSSRLLGERLNVLGKLGCVSCMTGSMMIVLHAPKEQVVSSMAEVESKLLDSAFLSYVIVILLLASVTVFFVAPTFGQRNPLVYVYISGSLGSLTVMLCKVLGVALRETFGEGPNHSRNWVVWGSVMMLVMCVAVQMNYLNKALDVFGAALVTPLLYVIFTAFVLLASAVLFREWTRMGAPDLLGILCGLVTVVVAVALLQAFKDLRVSFGTLVRLPSSTVSAESTDLQLLMFKPEETDDVDI